MDYKDEIEKLSKKVCCKSNKFYDNLAAFPTTGKVNTLYIDKETAIIYIWDGTTYLSTRGGDNF